MRKLYEPFLLLLLLLLSPSSPSLPNGSFSLSLSLSRGEGGEEEEGVLKSYCPLVLVGGKGGRDPLSLYRLTEKWEDGTFLLSLSHRLR